MVLGDAVQRFTLLPTTPLLTVPQLDIGTIASVDGYNMHIRNTATGVSAMGIALEGDTTATASVAPQIVLARGAGGAFTKFALLCTDNGVATCLASAAANDLVLANYGAGNTTWIAQAAGPVIIGTTASGATATFDASHVTTLTGALNMSTHQIHNVVDPTSAQDAATQAYVLAHAGGGVGGSGVGSAETMWTGSNTIGVQTVADQLLIGGPTLQSFNVPNTAYAFGEINREEIGGVVPAFPADLFVHVIRNSATADTTAHTQRSGGLAVEVSSTRSTGGNDLDDIAIECSAVGGQTNNCIEALQGDVVVDNGNITTNVGFIFSAGFLAASGTVFPESSGTNAVDISGAPTNAIKMRQAASQIDVDNASPSTLTLYNAGGGTFGLVVSGDETVANNTTLGTNGGTTVLTVLGRISLFGENTGDLYTNDANLDCAYNTNASATCKISAQGYLSGTTQFRSTEVDDGKAGSLALFDGPNSRVSITGTGGLGVTAITALGGHLRTTSTAITTGDLTCGAAPAVGTGSTDTAGTITVGAVSTTSCVVTFKATYTTPPFCTCSSDAVTSGGVFTGCSTTATALTATLVAGTAQQKFTYVCVGP